MRKKGKQRKEHTLRDTVAGRLILSFIGLRQPKHEPAYKCPREGSQAYYADHEHVRERARNLFRPGPERAAFIQQERSK